MIGRRRSRASPVALALLVLALCDATCGDDDACYAEETQPYSWMGTKTAYEATRRNEEKLKIDEKCSPIQIWALIRHGTRYPNRDEMKQFLSLRQVRDKVVDNHDGNGKGELCRAGLENLREWDLTPPSSEMKFMALAPRGAEEMRGLAKRLQDAFPELLRLDRRNFSQKDRKFRATVKDRAQESLRAFTEGLFGGGNPIVAEAPPENDILLYTYKNCPAYEKSLISDRVVEAETNKFTAGPEFRNLLRRVSKRLGFGSILDNDTVLLMYEVCRYEKAWLAARLSPWCAVFSAEDVRVLEYREDVGCYYYCGPGRRINEMLGCPPLQDMVRHFRNLRNSVEEPKGIFYFSHTVTLQATMAAMGIGKDDRPLLAENYASMGNRSFRTSFIGPFAGNVVAAYYKCEGEKAADKVAMYVSERLWEFEGCDGGVCDWEQLQRRFGKAADECSLDFCYK